MYLSMISILAPTFLGVGLFRSLPRELRILAFFVFATCLLEGVVYVAWLYNVNNLGMFHLFTFVEFIFVSIIYYRLLKSIRVVRYAILALGLFFMTASAYILFKQEYFDQYNSTQRGIEQLIILVYVLLFLYLFSKRLPEERHLLKPYFYLSIGWLIYFSGTFVIFLDAYGYIDLSRFLNWSVHSVLNIFLNAIYFAVFWMAGRMMRSNR